MRALSPGGARLWAASLGIVVAAHVAAGAALSVLRGGTVAEPPAGAFAIELAPYPGGRTVAKPGGAPPQAAAAQPHAAPAPPQAAPPQPKVAAVTPPVVKSEPKPKPKPVAKPKPQPREAVPLPQPAAAPQEAETAVAAAAPAAPGPATPVASAVGAPGSAAAPSAAAGPGAGEGGGVIEGRLGAGGSGEGTPLGRYKVLVFHALWENRRYPPLAQRMGYQGETVIEFTVASSGDIGNSRVVTGSGYGVLDRETEALLKRVGRLPPFPPDLRRSTLTFRIAIPFRLS